MFGRKKPVEAKPMPTPTHYHTFETVAIYGDYRVYWTYATGGLTARWQCRCQVGHSALSDGEEVYCDSCRCVYRVRTVPMLEKAGPFEPQDYEAMRLRRLRNEAEDLTRNLRAKLESLNAETQPATPKEPDAPTCAEDVAKRGTTSGL